MLDKGIYTEIATFVLNFKSRLRENDPELKNDLIEIENKLDGEIYPVSEISGLLDVIGELLEKFQYSELIECEQYNIFINFLNLFQGSDYVNILEYRVKLYYIKSTDDLEDFIVQLENIGSSSFAEIEFKYNFFNIFIETVLRFGTDEQVSRATYLINTL